MEYIIFTGGEKNELFDLLFADLKEMSNVTIDSGMLHLSKFKEKLWKLHHNKKMNMKKPMPFRAVWNKYSPLNNYIEKLTNGDICLVFSNISIEYFEPAYLNSIKKKYKVKLVLYFLDAYDTYYASRAKISRSQIDFDEVYSFYEEDAKKYDMRYFNSYYSVVKDKERIAPSHDIFFWGSDRGRGQMIESAFQAMKNEGIDADFGICYSDDSRSKVDGIVYNQPLEYNELLERMNESRCIMDIVGEYSNGMSLRVFEAIAYNKKLISNNQSIRKLKYYNSEYMQIVDSFDAIDYEFIKDKGEVDYQYDNEFSPVNWIKELDEVLKNR